jgi:gliding motility-associated-like protein
VNVSSYQGTDGAIDLTVSGGNTPYVYSWSNSTTTEDIDNVPAGFYSVIVTDSAGCSAYATLDLIAPLPLQMPTGISPNGDGKNDLFVVHGLEIFPNNHLTIFNRWGNIVYQVDGYQNKWDGTNSSGDALPAGTYFVILEINNKEIVLKGYVDIRRD